MNHWVKLLRDQIEQIAQKDFQWNPATFVDAPEDIAQISEDLDRLSCAFAERERRREALTHEVHHRVKNHLQIVTSLLKLQARNIDDPVCRQPLEQAQIRLSALALIHRLLYEQDEDPRTSRISITQLFAGLSAQLRFAFPGRDAIHFSCQVSGHTIPLDTAVPLALFVVEGVTNAYSHAFPDDREGVILLEFANAGERDHLSICDNGTGFDVQSDATSMGRKLMAAFARQLGGALAIESASTAGTVVTLSYPTTTAD